MDSELTQMMQRYEHLYHEQFPSNPEVDDDKERTERVDLFYTLLRRGYILDTRTEPWQWITIEPEEED